MLCVHLFSKRTIGLVPQARYKVQDFLLPISIRSPRSFEHSLGSLNTAFPTEQSSHFQTLNQPFQLTTTNMRVAAIIVAAALALTVSANPAKWHKQGANRDYGPNAEAVAEPAKWHKQGANRDYGPNAEAAKCHERGN
jgi:hypothetical protein